MGVHCEINFAKSPQHVYCQNSAVSGQIKYILNEDKAFKNLTVSLKGVGFVKIYEDRRKDSRTYVKKETYVKIDNVLLDVKKKLPAGGYETNFYFMLPPNIPASLKYHGDHGRFTVDCEIKYYIRMKFEQSGFAKLNLSFKKEIKVHSGITPVLQTVPVVFGEKKKLLSVFNTSEVFIKSTIEKCVYKPDETIKLNYEVLNDSNVTIKSVKSKLVEVYTFLDKFEFVNKIPLTDTKTSTVKRGKNSMMDIEIAIPENLFCLENSTLVRRNYAVFIKVVLIGHRNTLLKIPIQIGELNSEIGTDCETGEPPSYWEAMEEFDEKKESIE